MKKNVNGVQEVVSFQSPEAVEVIRAAAKKIPELQKKAVEARRIAGMVHSNPSAIELQGKNPVEESRIARAKADQAEGDFSRSRGELAQLFISERADFDIVRGRLLSKLNREQISPAAAQLQKLVAQVESVIEDLIAKVSAVSVSNESGELERFDGSIVAWNKLCGECGAPANAYVDPTNAIRISAASLYLQSAKDVSRLTTAVTRLQGAVAATQTRLAKASSAR
jgi:hypothetical protein